MKKILNIFILFSLLGQVKAQMVSPQIHKKNEVHRCYTVEAYNDFLKKHPNGQTMQQFEAWLQSKIGQRRRALLANGKTSTNGGIINYTLPIVFHVIENGEPEGSGDNIAQSFIQAQLLQLNKDYANQSGSQYSVASPTGIQFALATQDPNGKTLAEPGIDRVDRTQMGWSAAPYEYTTLVTDTIKPMTIWDPYSYVNVWMLGSFQYSGNAGLLGIATLPTCPQLNGLDTSETDQTAGVCVLSSSVGSIYSSTTCGSVTNPYNLGRTLTHELGHLFGLRHIWGDGYCATDYCDDTPIHYYANYGKPTHPKPNDCGSPDEMFEDYMDYTDDDVMTTFTASQMERMQTVMLNSPRRMTLATSTVPTTLPPGSNKLSFARCSGVLSVSETGNTGTFQRYKDVIITLNAEKTATGRADVIINTSGTAKKNIDYQLLSDTVTFLSGDGAKSFTLRILDNNTIDTDRTVILTYNIIGSGLVKAATGQSLTVTIEDDDNKLIGNNSVKIINENFGTTGGVFPKGWSTDSSSGSRNFFVVGPKSLISTGQWAYLTNNRRTKPLTYTQSTNADYAEIVLPQIDGGKYKSIDTFQFKYKVGGLLDTTTYNGNYGTLNYTIGTYSYYSTQSFGLDLSTTGAGPYYETTQQPVIPVNGFLNNIKFQIGFEWDANSTKAGRDTGLCIDDVVLTGTPFPIDSLVSNTYTEIAPASTNNLLRDTSDNIIASVVNPSKTLQTLTGSIIEAGAGKIGFSTGTSVFQRSQKVINLSNGNVDSTTTYNLTLYFTTNELQSWGSLSGLRVLHLKDGVVLPPTFINNTNSTILTPISVVDNRTTGGYAAITVSSTGLGSFALVDSTVTLPISWKFVNGTIENNATQLKWALGNDDAKTRFTIEKSSDGIHFSTIAQNISATTFTDASVVAGTHYYYRIVANTVDGNTLYSQVINVVYLSNHHSITIAPNPFSNYLVIQNNSILGSNTNITVYDVAGREVYVNKNGTQNTNINTANWRSGVYIVKINNNGEPFTYKLIKN